MTRRQRGRHSTPSRYHPRGPSAHKPTAPGIGSSGITTAVRDRGACLTGCAPLFVSAPCRPQRLPPRASGPSDNSARSAGQDRTQGGGEGAGVVEEAIVTAGEGDRRSAQTLGHGHGGTARHHLAGLGSDAQDNAGGCRAERAEIVLVAGAGGHVRSEQRVVARAVVAGRQPECGGIRGGLPGKAGRDRARVAGQRDELGHRLPKLLRW